MSSDLEGHANTPKAKQLTEIEQITHDLNNQVMVIQGNAAVLRAQVTEWPDIHELAEQIIIASQQASALTKQLAAKTSRPVGTTK